MLIDGPPALLFGLVGERPDAWRRDGLQRGLFLAAHDTAEKCPWPRQPVQPRGHKQTTKKREGLRGGSPLCWCALGDCST